jgi:hypothetical protein
MYPIIDVKPTFWPYVLADGSARDRSPSAQVRSLSAPLRGYWVDEDVLETTGIPSAAILKKLIACRAVRADYIGREEGGRVRAWSASNVLRAYLVRSIADAARISLIASGVLMRAMGSDHLDRLLGTTALLADLECRVGNQSALGDAVYADLGERVPQATLVILDWRDVGIIVGTDQENLIPLARIHRLDGPSPEVRTSTRASGEALVELRVEIGPILIEFMRAVLRIAL